MNYLLFAIVLLLYCAIGCMTNGMLNEEWQKFSVILTIIWPIALFMFLFFYFIGLFMTFGKIIKIKSDTRDQSRDCLSCSRHRTMECPNSSLCDSTLTRPFFKARKEK